MKTFNYVAFRKKRGRVESYAGDGVWEAETMTQARKEIAQARNYPAKRLRLSLKSETFDSK